MADENSIYNITEYDNSLNYSKDDIVALGSGNKFFLIYSFGFNRSTLFAMNNGDVILV